MAVERILSTERLTLGRQDKGQLGYKQVDSFV
jgi:hypothetical protein